VTELAETCQKLAKFPNLRNYGPKFVKTEHYLHEALYYLFDATHSGDPIDFVFTVCENIQELSQKWLHTRFQVIVPCIPGEHVYA
jgi:hypothetical protein